MDTKEIVAVQGKFTVDQESGKVVTCPFDPMFCQFLLYSMCEAMGAITFPRPDDSNATQGVLCKGTRIDFNNFTIKRGDPGTVIVTLRRDRSCVG